MTESYDIPAAAKELSYTQSYVRSLIRRGLLKSTLQPIARGAKVRKHMVSRDDIKTFQRNRTRRSRRKDGRNKWIVYANFDEMYQVITLLESNDLSLVADTIKPANKIQARPSWLEERDG